MLEEIKEKKLFEKINWKMFKYILIYLFFSVLVVNLYYIKLKDTNKEYFEVISNGNKVTLFYILVSIFIVTVIGILLLVINKKKNLEIHQKFFLITGFVGVMLIFTTPLFSNSDEKAHFFRIYEITQGSITTPKENNVIIGSKMPSSLWEIFSYKETNMKYKDVIYVAKNIHLNEENVKDYLSEYYTASVYSPVNYAPQIIGVLLGKILNLNIYYIAILGRITGYICYLVLCTYAIKKLPCKKLFASLILMMPTMISFSVTLTGDLLTNAISIFFISYICEILYNKRKTSSKDYIILGILATILALCKLVYLPLIGLVFLLPKKNFKTKKEMYIVKCTIIIIAVIISLIWLKQTNITLPNDIDKSNSQLKYLITHPISYFFTIVETFSTKFNEYIMGMVGDAPVGKGNLYPAITYIYICFILYAFLDSSKKEILDKKSKILVACIFLTIVLLISTALYIQYNAMVYPLYNHFIYGIQGRYFIPIVLLLIMSSNKMKLECNENLIFNFLVVLQIPIILTIITTFLI